MSQFYKKKQKKYIDGQNNEIKKIILYRSNPSQKLSWKNIISL